MEKPKVLFILHLPPPVHGAAMMGKFIYDSKIINNNFNCSYINLTLAKDINDIGKGGFKKLFNLSKLIYNINKKIKIDNPEICYVTPNAKGGAFYKDFLIVMTLKILKQKIVLHFHNKGVSKRQNNFFDNILYKYFFKNVKVILLAEELYPDICKYVSRKDVYICPNGIPQQNDIPIKKNHEDFNILFLSNMMKEKGVWDLIEACKILNKKGRNFKCHFVGKWSDISENEFNNRIRECNIENRVFSYGAKYGSDKRFFFETADIFVFPTFYHNETFGLVLLEAMEYEIPCITTNEGGVPSVIDNGTTGFVINKNSPKELAEKIEILMENPKLRMEMGKAGRIKFEKEFTIYKFENRMKDILNDISRC